MFSLSTLALGLLPLAVVATPMPQGGPGVPNKSFELYAYGDEFGGLPVIYYQGKNRTCRDVEELWADFPS
jgi:hypothetical protein